MTLLPPVNGGVPSGHRYGVLYFLMPNLIIVVLVIRDKEICQSYLIMR